MQPNTARRWTLVTIGILTLTASGGGALSAHASERASDVQEIFELNKAIDAKEGRLEEIQRKIETYRRSIAREQGKASSLRQRLAVLDDRIERQRLEIERVRTEFEQVELEIAATQLDMRAATTNLERRRALLRAVLTELRALDAQPQIHAVLASDTIGAYFAERNRVAQLQGDLGRVLSDVRRQREELAAEDRQLTARKEELEALASELREEEESLSEEQDEKQRILNATQNNERRYQQLVTELKAEVAAIDAEIVALESTVRAKLTAIDEHFGTLGRVAFSWPVPNRGITTYFHDPEYPYRHIFEHPAIDVRAAQGSTIAAPAPGYVAKTKDNGYGYSYLMLVHPGGFSTVYGHVSCFKVAEGTYVDRGDPIACVGGRPGSRGAGRLTTGSHLHFEVRLNGIPVNPLNYLL